LSERGREAPKSLDVLELIEASANIGRRECECLSVVCSCAPIPPFIGSRRDGLHARVISRVVPFFPNRGRIVDGSCCRALWGMASGVVAVLESPLTVPRACPYPVVPVDGVAVARCAPRLTRRGAEGATDGGLGPVKGRTAFEVAAHARRGSCRGESTKIW